MNHSLSLHFQKKKKKKQRVSEQVGSEMEDGADTTVSVPIPRACGPRSLEYSCCTPDKNSKDMEA